ncbi:hypothetical protein GH5_03985 [Leishmania sp. Ghana 2012 LV757]|uniref:hypothetical protein n=1 Tax=Leishmania sp. Ghana 2012 LV757 TaxID=2803181 RepID=UPI001B7CB8E0|nr:hypothetical protein GH5_03985 [Leishmania sp. Ghana 2012 LV757]
MSFSFPSPARHSKSRRESYKPEKYSTTPSAQASSTRVAAFILSSGNALQNAWTMELRHASQVTEDDAGDDRDFVASLSITEHLNGSCDGNQEARRREGPRKPAEDFKDWLAAAEEQRGGLATAPQTDLSLWFHNERLAAKTPFAAVVPCPAPLHLEKTQQSVSAVIDSFAFQTFFVQTLPMGAKLSDVAQAFVKRPAHLPGELPYPRADQRGVCAYTAVPCHGGNDVIKLVKRSLALQDAVRDVPCLLLNDYCPLAPLCLRCLVVAGRCVAAEVACDEVYAPLFCIHTNIAVACRAGADGRWTAGRSSDTSAAVPPRLPTTATGKDGESTGERTASDVLAYGLQAYVKQAIGHSLGCRSYTVVLMAEVKSFDTRVLGPQADDPPFWPAWTHRPLHQKPSPFEENGLRFHILSLEYADPGPFEPFAPEELCAIGDYVVEREKVGTVLPPVLRFLDGHEAQRAAARRSGSPASVSGHRSRVEPSPGDEGNGKASRHTSASSHKPTDVACEASSISNRATSTAANCSSAGPQRRYAHRRQGDEVRPLKPAAAEAAAVLPNVQSHRPSRPPSTSSSSAAPVAESTISAPPAASMPRSLPSSNAGKRDRRSSSIKAPTSSLVHRAGNSEREDMHATKMSSSFRDSGSNANSGSSRASRTRLPLRLSSLRLPACATAVAPVAGAEAVECLPPRHADPSVTSSRSSVDAPSHYALPSPLARLQESIAVGALVSQTTPTGPARSALSTRTASAYRSRLPERRLSTAAVSLSTGCRGSVPQSVSHFNAAATTCSARSSPSPSSMLSEMGATCVAEAAGVRASDVSDRAGSQAASATSATKSSRRSTVISSHCITADKDSVAAAQLVLEQTTTAEDFASIASVRSSKHGTHPAYSEPQFSTPLPKAKKFARASQVAEKGMSTAQAPPEDVDHDVDEKPAARRGVIQLPSQVREPQQCNGKGHACNEAEGGRCYSVHHRDKELKGHPIDEVHEAEENALLGFSSMPPSISQRSTITTMTCSQPRRLSISVLSLRPSDADGADREVSSVFTHMMEQGSKEVRAACTSSCAQSKAAAEGADMASYRSSATSSFYADTNAEAPAQEAPAAEGAHSAEEAGGGVISETVTSAGGHKDVHAEDGAGKAATSSSEDEGEAHEDATNADDAALARVHAKSCDEQPARALLDLGTSTRSKSRSSIPRVEGADDTRRPAAELECCDTRQTDPEGSARDKGDEEAHSASHSDYIGHTLGHTDLRILYSTDFESCTSTAASAVSSEILGRRQWLGRLALDGNQRPPSHAPSCAHMVGIASARHERDAGFTNVPFRMATPVPVGEKSASPAVASASDSCSACETSSETSSSLSSRAPSKMNLRLPLPYLPCSVDSALN